MSAIEIFGLKCLEAAARLGSLTAAARALGVSQPAVSVQVAGMEKRLGTRLLDRASRGVRPTPAGERFLARALRILDEVRALEGDWQAGPLGGVLRIGATDVVVLHRLPEVLREFREAHPQVEIVLRVEGSLPLAGAVRAREVDLAILTLPLPAPPGPLRPLYRDRLCFVASPAHPLSRRKRIDLSSLAGAPLLGHKEGSVTRELIRGFLTARGHTPRFAMEVSSPEVLRRLAREGLGVAVLPEISVREEVRKGHLVILPVAGFSLDRVSGLLVPPGGPPSREGRAFRDQLLDAVEHGRQAAAGRRSSDKAGSKRPTGGSRGERPAAHGPGSAARRP